MNSDDPQVLYRLYDADDRLLYVGITMNPESRFASHQREKPWWRDVATIRIEHFDDRASVAAAEIQAIQTERPAHNLTGAIANSVQFNFRIPESDRRDVIAIAKQRRERDGYGFGASVVVRQALADYVAKYEHLLVEQRPDA